MIDFIVFHLVSVRILQISESSTALLLRYEVLCALKVNMAEKNDNIFHAKPLIEEGFCKHAHGCTNFFVTLTGTD